MGKTAKPPSRKKLKPDAADDVKAAAAAADGDMEVGKRQM